MMATYVRPCFATQPCPCQVEHNGGLYVFSAFVSRGSAFDLMQRLAEGSRWA